MGSTKTHRSTETINCKTCGQRYTTACDYQQGRCPHHPALIDLNAVFQNLLRFFKGK